MINRKIYIFIGTTAELIKLAPIIQKLNERAIQYTILASGQNNINFKEFKDLIGNPEVNKAVTPKSEESSVFKFVIWAARTFFSILIGMKYSFQTLDKSNSYFIIHGDTVSSLMGSLVAKLYGLKLVHVESGLRSFNFLEPFPEELSRYIISRLADVHFCPNKWSVHNLSHAHGEKVNTGENTLIETFWSEIEKKSTSSLVQSLKKSKTKYFVLVAHRQEHVIFDKIGTEKVLEFILKNVASNLKCIFVMHDLSTDFINSLKKRLGDDIFKNVILSKRLTYVDYMHLLNQAEFMITDGGSNQEEMYYMGKPCLLLRNVTERIEGLNKNVLLSKNNTSVIKEFLEKYSQYKTSPVKINKRPSEIIVDYLVAHA